MLYGINQSVKCFKRRPALTLASPNLIKIDIINMFLFNFLSSHILDDFAGLQVPDVLRVLFDAAITGELAGADGVED
jgi:hypothetical protein